MTSNILHRWKTDPEYIELMNFLIERTKDSKSPLNITHLAEEFKEKSGSSQGVSCLSSRIFKFRSEIHQLDTIDTETRVKMVFALSAPIDEDFLEKLRMDAHVEVDWKSRITKYIAKDETLELEGDHSRTAKMIYPNYDRELIELIDFVIERTKDSNSPLNITQLAEEFKENSGSSQEIACLVGRINKFRSEIHQLGSLDTETEVRMVFALSIPIDKGFLKELRMNAHVELDECNRITKYIAKDESLELEGDHGRNAKRRWTRSSNPIYVREQVELMNFLIERTKDSKTPLSLTQLAEEFKESSGSSQGLKCLVNRIFKFRSEIHQLDTIDTETKIKMIIALSVPIDEDFLNELRKTAHVEIDEKNRITKFIANDGSLELAGDHSRLAKIKIGWKRSRASKSQKDYDDESQDSLPRTPESKRAKDSSPDRFMKIEDYDPDYSSMAPESSASEPSNPGIQQLLQPNEEGALDTPFKTDPDDGYTPNALDSEIQQLRQPKEQGSAQQPPILAKEESDPEVPGTRTDQEAPMKTEPVADDGYASRMKFLKTIHSLVLNLDMPSLSPLQEKIDKKLRESSPNAIIPNDEMIMAMEALMTKIANRSVLKFSENVESVSLKEFLCYLKAAILNWELEGLEGLLEKIKERIKEPASKDKNIPVETVASALQYALDGFSF